MRIAVYRCLYGQDFVQESIKSIIGHVDKVFVFYTNKAWGHTTKCVYKGREIIFPEKFDNILDKIKELKRSHVIYSEKIVLVEQTPEMNPKSIPQNLYTTIINDYIIPLIGKPDLIIIPEVDHVFRSDQIKDAIGFFLSNGLPVAKTRQIELWRYPSYRIAERLNRIGTVLWNMKKTIQMPYTKGNGEIDNIPTIPFFNHNFGFAVSYEVMFWKHMTALAFSSVIHDSLPDEDWLLMWTNWDYETNNKDLEISKNYKHTITHAYPYDVKLLPELIREKFNL